MKRNYEDLFYKIAKSVPRERLFTDELHTLAYGTDASFYRLTPQIVAKVENPDEVRAIIKNCEIFKLPMTFRAAGTSLSGQAVSDSVLVKLGSNWKKIDISEDRSTVTLGPGVVGAFANAALAKYGKKIGPDPASINAAMIGGIAANNASGMCCGTSQNTYKTLKSMKLILADGYVLDTGNKENVEDFKKNHSDFIKQLLEIRTKVTADHQLYHKIKEKYKIKNTTGYSLNSLVDFDCPIDILQHLIIGSEGTLGFISDITLFTVEEQANKASALMLFPNTKLACEAVILMKHQCSVSAVEYMDRASLRSIEEEKGIPDIIKTLSPDVSALLVETRASSREDLISQIGHIKNTLSQIETVVPIEFTDDPAEYGLLWNIRKGIFPAIGAVRKTGTTVIIEDVAFPVDKLADATLDLQDLFVRHGYTEAVIYGHALDGNLHFVFMQDFNDMQEIKRYEVFMDDVCKLVVNKYGGSLKAEHGTGRNMAPYVELEWGEKAYSIMKDIKTLFDPETLLNPGVIINEDKEAHTKNLKPLPAAYELVDKCIECGFCEVNCPSKNLSLTPRQRIVITREIERIKRSGGEKERLAKLTAAFDYEGNETCATDGLCATACPVHIDTGKLIKLKRNEGIPEWQNKIADYAAGHFAGITSTINVGLNFVDICHKILGSDLMGGIAGSMRKLSGKTVPQWNKYLPAGTKYAYKNVETNKGLKVVYFPSCISRNFGIAKDSNIERSQSEVTVELLKKAGYDVIYPDNLDSLCCGMAFASKGFFEQGNLKSKELIEQLQKASQNGKYPILFDTSPCLYRTQEFLIENNIEVKIYEPVEFILKFLADKLTFKPIDEEVAIHVTCSSKKLGLDQQFVKLAKMCSNNVIVPEGIGCCGVAGDRVFNVPELNESALKTLKEQIPNTCHDGYSNSRTCEIGLSLQSGIHYKSIVYLVEKATV